MQLLKLHVFILLVAAASSSAMTIRPKNALHARYHRRDHGSPFQADESPRAQSTSNTLAPTTDPGSAFVIGATSPTPPATAAATSSTQPTISTASASLSTEPASPSDIVTTDEQSPSTTSISHPSMPSSASSPTLAPIATTSSSSGRTWVIVGIFALAFGLLGLVICILGSHKRRARRTRRKRARAVKRDVEVVNRVVVGTGDEVVREEEGKWEDTGLIPVMVEKEGKGGCESRYEGYDEGLPAYHR